MKQVCILPKDAEKLKQAFKMGEVSIANLYKLGSSEARIKTLEKYIGNNAKFVNTSLERAFISPNQKKALQNWVYKNIADTKPLYKGLTLEESQKLSNLDIPSLKKMTPEHRINEMGKYVDKEKAKILADKFEELKKSGNLDKWEARVMGTNTVKEAKRLKGELAKIEILDDLGVLNPKQVEDFMESFVESKLGVSLTMEESAKISKLANEQIELLDKINKSGDWTFKNKENVMALFEKRAELDNLMNSLGENDVVETIADIMRANILASPRILKNSFLYQALPAAERTITKRLVSGNFSDKILKSSFFQKVQAKMSGVVPNKEAAEFIKNQTQMALEIYHKTGYDISRMNELADGEKIFGERFGAGKGKNNLLNRYAKIANLAPKWMAGGTDTLFANIGRADTATMMSREIAKFEELKGILPKGVTREQRATQLLKDSYSFNTKDPRAIQIREASILDAHKMNGTQNSKIANKLIKLRDNLNLGNLKLGKIIVPFLKIPATITAEGIKVATGRGIYKSISNIIKASKLEGIERTKLMSLAVNDLIRYLGFTGSAIFITTLLDNDDYVGSWETMNYDDYKLIQATGGSTDMIRIGGKWIPLRFLPIIDIPIAAEMSRRQAIERGNNGWIGYAQGMAGQILSMPGIKEIKDILTKMGGVAKAQDKEEAINSLGLDGKTLKNWAKVRFLPSFLSYDIYNKLAKQEKKYDYLGREIEKANFMGIRKDISNELTNEIQRLKKEGFQPTISDPSLSQAKKIIEIAGPEGYIKWLNEEKRNLAKKNLELINSDKYKEASDEEKQKLLNANRKKYLLNRLK